MPGMENLFDVGRIVIDAILSGELSLSKLPEGENFLVFLFLCDSCVIIAVLYLCHNQKQRRK